MNFNNLRLFYINLFLILAFILKLYSFIILILVWKLSYSVRKDSFVQQTIESHNRDIHSEDSFYYDQDIDNTYWATIFNQEVYLFYNCRFVFDIYGGNSILSLEHYYIINNNYNNIYNNLYINKKYTDKSEDLLFNKVKNYYNFSYNYNNPNYIKYNIIMNNYNIKFIKDIKFIYRLKIISKKIKYINEKNN